MNFILVLELGNNQIISWKSYFRGEVFHIIRNLKKAVLLAL